MSGFEPYAPPSVESQLSAPTQDHTDSDYRPADGLTKTIVIVLWAHVGLAVLNIGSHMMQIELLARMSSGDFTMDEAEANDTRVGLLGLGYLALLLTSAILLFVWFNRMNKNARSLGAEHMTYGPNGWGWFFCPFLNLWRPLAAFKELWTASQDPTRVEPPPSYFGLWWAGWIVLSILGNIEGRMAVSEDIDSLQMASMLSVVTEAGLIVASIALISVVRGIHRVQSEYAHARAGSPGRS